MCTIYLIVRNDNTRLIGTSALKFTLDTLICHINYLATFTVLYAHRQICVCVYTQCVKVLTQDTLL